MRSRATLFGFLVAGTAAVALLILIRSDPPQLQQEIAGLKAELAALRTAVQEQAEASRRAEGSRMTPELAASLAARQPSRGPPEEAAPGSSTRPEDQASRQDEPPQMTDEQAQAMVLDAYAEETMDSTWSVKATDKLSAVVRDHLPSGSQLTSLECRTTMCQVKVVHKTPEAHSSFVMDGFMGWPGSVFVAGEEQHREELAVTLIAVREDMELPLGSR